MGNQGLSNRLKKRQRGMGVFLISPEKNTAELIVVIPEEDVPREGRARRSISKKPQKQNGPSPEKK